MADSRSGRGNFGPRDLDNSITPGDNAPSTSPKKPSLPRPSLPRNKQGRRKPKGPRPSGFTSVASVLERLKVSDPTVGESEDPSHVMNRQRTGRSTAVRDGNKDSDENNIETVKSLVRAGVVEAQKHNERSKDLGQQIMALEEEMKSKGSSKAPQFTLVTHLLCLSLVLDLVASKGVALVSNYARHKLDPF